MALYIGPKEEEALNAAVERARAHPVAMDQVMRAAQAIDQATHMVTLAERKATPPVRIALQQVELPDGYRVAISVEEQPAGMCLHLSMSSGARGKVPHPAALAMVLEAIGIKPGGFAGRTWIEEFEVDGKPGGHAANVIVVIAPAQGGHA